MNSVSVVALIGEVHATSAGVPDLAILVCLSAHHQVSLLSCLVCSSANYDVSVLSCLRSWRLDGEKCWEL